MWLELGLNVLLFASAATVYLRSITRLPAHAP
jgi:hypothetical protein